MIAYEVPPQAARFANRHSLCQCCGRVVLITQRLWRQVMTSGWRQVHCPECGELDMQAERLRQNLRRSGSYFPKSRQQWERELATVEAELARRRAWDSGERNG